MKRHLFLSLLCLSNLVLSFGQRNAFCKFPPELAGDQFTEEAYWYCRQNRPKWTDEQCYDFVLSVRDVLESAPFVITREQIESVLERIRTGWAIIPGAVSGEARRFELEKAAWKRRLTEVAFVKWQMTPEERATAWSQWELVMEFFYRGGLRESCPFPTTFLNAHSSRYRSAAEKALNDPFDGFLLRSLSEEEKTYVHLKMYEKLKAVASTSCRERRTRVMSLGHAWEKAYSKGDSAQISQAYQALEDEVRKIPHYYDWSEVIDLFRELVYPEKTAEYVELVEEGERAVVEETRSESEELLPEWREENDTERQTQRATAIQKRTRRPVGGRKSIPSAHKEEDRREWVVPLICVLVTLLALVGVMVLVVREKSASWFVSPSRILGRAQRRSLTYSRKRRH